MTSSLLRIPVLLSAWAMVGAIMVSVPYGVALSVADDSQQCTHDGARSGDVTRSANNRHTTAAVVAPDQDPTTAPKPGPAVVHPPAGRWEGYYRLIGLSYALACGLYIFTVLLSYLALRKPSTITLDIPPDTPHRELIEQIWRADVDSSANSSVRIFSNGVIFATLAAVIPSLCAILLLYSLWSTDCVTSDFQGTVEVLLSVAVCTLGASLTSVVLSVADMTARTGARDVSDRAFSNAGRSLLLTSLCAAVAAVGISGHFLSDDSWISNSSQVLVIGIILGVAGDFLFAGVIEFISLMFGRTSGLDEDVQSFMWIDGLDDQESLRLRETGIRSAQALALVSPTYIYFRTRYSFERICDWQEQALLYMLLGDRLLRVCRKFLIFRGIDELIAVLKERSADGALTPSQLNDLKAILRVLEGNRQVSILQAWRQCRVVRMP